jgi:lipoprotein-releasing system permease protein
VAVALGVAALVVVMSVMNGFRAELLDKIVGLNGHAIIQAYGGRLDNWEQVLKDVRATPGVVKASPLIEQPLLTTFNGRVEAILVRGQTAQDIAAMQPKVISGSMASVAPDAGTVGIGARLAESLGARVGDSITVINPTGRDTPFGTVPRQVSYQVGAIFEVGIYDYDNAFVIMPIPDAQRLLLTGDSIGMIEVKTDNADKAAEMLAPLGKKLAGQATITDWKTINAQLFDALAVDRVVTFVVLSLIVLVASFNILSSLIGARQDARHCHHAHDGRFAALDHEDFLTIGAVIGSLGTGAGLVLGFVFLFYRQNVLNFVQLVTGQQLWDPKIRFLTELPSRSDPVEVIGIVAMALGLSFVFTLFPAFKAASTDPVQVLRYE